MDAFDAAVVAYVAEQRRRHAFRTNTVDVVMDTGECSESCSIDRIDVTLYDGTRAPKHLTVNGVHPCTRFCTELNVAAAHARRTIPRNSQVVNGLIWCQTHCIFHLCGPSCALAQRTARGQLVCVLSGQIVQVVSQSEYGGSGTRADGINFDDNDHDDKVSNWEVSKNDQLTKRTKSTQADNAIRSQGLHIGSGNQQSIVEGVRSFTGLSHPDEPHIGMFSDNAHENTFGDACGEYLDVRYAEAFACLQHIMTSPARDGAERAQITKTMTEARRAVNAYVRRTKRDRRPVVLTRVYESFDTAVQSVVLHRRFFCVEGHLNRLLARVAFALVEFYVELRSATADLLAHVDAHSAACFQRFRNVPFSNLVPLMLPFFKHGISIGDRVLVAADWFVEEWYPKSLVLHKLIGNDKTVSNHRKDLYKTLSSVVHHSVIVDNSIEATVISDHFIFFESGSVVAALLTARRQRLGL